MSLCGSNVRFDLCTAMLVSCGTSVGPVFGDVSCVRRASFWVLFGCRKLLLLTISLGLGKEKIIHKAQEARQWRASTLDFVIGLCPPPFPDDYASWGPKLVKYQTPPPYYVCDRVATPVPSCTFPLSIACFRCHRPVLCVASFCRQRKNGPVRGGTLGQQQHPGSRD